MTTLLHLAGLLTGLYLFALAMAAGMPLAPPPAHAWDDEMEDM